MAAHRGDAEQTGWREIRNLGVSFWQEMRAGPQPLPVLYLRCHSCGNVTPRISVVKSYSLTERGRPAGRGFGLRRLPAPGSPGRRRRDPREHHDRLHRAPEPSAFFL